jgi:hypothetical protein
MLRGLLSILLDFLEPDEGEWSVTKTILVYGSAVVITLFLGIWLLPRLGGRP